MKQWIIIFLALFVLAACGGSSTEPTPEPPTAVPEETPDTAAAPPPDEPTELETAGDGSAGSEHIPNPDLIERTWAWESRVPSGSAAAVIDVLNPEHYTLTFNEDGTFNAQVDCNRVAGSYVTTPPDGMSMEAGPSTLAACPPGSLADEMMQIFAEVQQFRFVENGNMLILEGADGSQDYFSLLDPPDVELPDPGEDAQAAVGTVTAPDGIFLRTGPSTRYPYIGTAPQGESGEIIGVSADGQWYLALAPGLPSGQIWAAAAYVEVENGKDIPVVGVAALDPDLVGIPWEWVSTTDPVQGTVVVQDPNRYLIFFDPDNTATIQADCNHVQAAYEVDGSSISITAGPSTLAACPADSQADAFLQQLANVTIFTIQGDNLYMDQMADGGTMRFVALGASVPEEDAPAEEADASTFYLVSFGPLDDPQPIIPGSTVTGHLADDLVSGFAGCNNFSGTVTDVDDYFTFSEIVTTHKICPEPAGVMEQEQAFLTALEAVNGYQFKSDITNGIEVITEGQLFYRMAGGGQGVMNFTTKR